MKVNTVCEIHYKIQEKAIIEALVKSQSEVENKTLGERLAEVEGLSTLADMLVAVEVDTLGEKLSMVNTKALVDTLAYTVSVGNLSVWRSVLTSSFSRLLQRVLTSLLTFT